MNYNTIASKFIELKQKALSGDAKDKLIFKKYQNYCMKSMAPLVNNRVAKYKPFPNYQDLQQDGFEALLMALQTYNPDKGNFGCWASFYIKTKVSRSANAHSTIRVPLKKARDTFNKPFKVNYIPDVMDSNQGPYQLLESIEDYDILKEALEDLPEIQKTIIDTYYGLSGKEDTLNNIAKSLNVSILTCARLLEKAKDNIFRSLEI